MSILPTKDIKNYAIRVFKAVDATLSKVGIIWAFEIPSLKSNCLKFANSLLANVIFLK